MNAGDASPPLRRFAVGLGSNLEDRPSRLALGLRRLREVAEDVRVSSVYETRPKYVQDQPDFLNACCIGRTRLSARQLLSQLLDAERAAGRTRTGQRYGPRALDLDLLLYNDARLDLPGLVVPHPRLRERAFVLVPLAEIAGNWPVPSLDGSIKTVASLAKDLGSEGVHRLEGMELA